MDLRDLQAVLPSITPSTPHPAEIFTFSRPRPQEFSISYPIIKYMIKNPQSGKAWKNLISTCKYFYSKNPILPIGTLEVLCDMKCKADTEQFDWTLPFPKLWIYDSFKGTAARQVSPLLPKIFKIELMSLWIYPKYLTWTDYQKLTLSGSIKNLYLHFGNMNISAITVPVDKHLKNLPELETLKIFFRDYAPYVFISDIVDRMLDLFTGYKKLRAFVLHGLDEDFDISLFKDFLLKNETIDISFKFKLRTPAAYRQKVENVLQEIRENPLLKVPCINYQ